MRRRARLVNGSVGVGERSPRVLQQRDPGRCELHVPGGPHEEHHPHSRSSSRIARDSGDCDICSRSAARPKCNSSATATKYHSFRSSTGGSTDADTDRAERRAPAKQRGRHFAFTAW
jgi:hypothetical protein